MWWQRLGDLLRFRLPRKDRDFVQSYLGEAGQFLFNQMSIADQKHSVRVARYIIKEASFQRGISLDLLVHAGLLHDVGKVKGEISRFNRLLVGVIRRLFPHRREKWSCRDKSSALRYSLYVDLVHPSRGSYMAESMGIHPRIVSLIRRHHDVLLPGENDAELALLKQADEKN